MVPGASLSSSAMETPTMSTSKTITERRDNPRSPSLGAENRCPTHPGEILREDVLPALELSVSEAARQLGVTRQMLHRILAERAAITPEMAVRIGRFCGNGPSVWLRMQQAYDLW